MAPGTRVELIEEDAGQDPACPIPLGVVVTAEQYKAAARRSLPAGEVPVRWDTPDFGPDIDCWPANRLRATVRVWEY
jgi:hypothetical protein